MRRKLACKIECTSRSHVSNPRKKRSSVRFHTRAQYWKSTSLSPCSMSPSTDGMYTGAANESMRLDSSASSVLSRRMMRNSARNRLPRLISCTSSHILSAHRSNASTKWLYASTTGLTSLVASPFASSTSDSQSGWESRKQTWISSRFSATRKSFFPPSGAGITPYAVLRIFTERSSCRSVVKSEKNFDKDTAPPLPPAAVTNKPSRMGLRSGKTA
mmetsp:Transcript_1225/g.3213  ORF Transcript_1225/g.3213 Transcript_1225/m.3213 type:complete len:216 (-) Transcript_1225:353-1000(-)